MVQPFVSFQFGPEHFNRRGKDGQAKRLVKRLQNLGFAVEITPIAA